MIDSSLSPTLTSSEPRAIMIVACDARKATLFHGTLTPPKRIDLGKSELLLSPWTDYHQHDRPSALSRTSTRNAVQQVAGIGHEVEELEQRFAREAAAWITQQRRLVPRAAVAIFAAPRFLGYLRGELSPLDRKSVV